MNKLTQFIILFTLLTTKAYAVVPVTINNASDINFPYIHLNMNGNCDMSQAPVLSGTLCANTNQYQGGFNVGTVNITHNAGARLNFNSNTFTSGPYRVTLTLWDGVNRVQTWYRLGTAPFCWEPWIPCTDNPMDTDLTIVANFEVINEPVVPRGTNITVPTLFEIICAIGC